MLFKSKNESRLFIDPIELLQLYKDAISELRRIKTGESLIIHENKREDFSISVYAQPTKHDGLVRTNKLLRELLIENEKDLKGIESAQGFFSSSEDGGNYCP